MADFPRRRRGELLRVLAGILAERPDGLPAGQALAMLERQVPPTPFEAGEYSNGTRRYEKLVRFSTIPCVKAGWMAKDRGRWYLTDDGRDALYRYPDPEAFANECIGRYRTWQKSRPAAAVDDEVIEEEANSTEITFERAGEQAWLEIERHVTTMPPYDFQDLVAALLRGMGYHVGWVAPPGRDGGVDIVAFNDPLGTRPPRIKVQVKRQQGRVSVDGLRSFMALLGTDDVGIFVNTGGFTRDADDEARNQATRRVTLLDLERLVELWAEHYGRLDEAARRRLPLQPIYFLAPEG